jgi:hypothetical protein
LLQSRQEPNCKFWHREKSSLQLFPAGS